MASALVLLAPGAEEMEFTIATDLLRRAGVDVTVAGVEGLEPVTCSRGVRIAPDVELRANALADVVVLPGGAGGAAVLAKHTRVGQVLKAHWEQKRWIAAVCAAPLALQAHGIALGSRITGHPSAMSQLAESYQLERSERVVIDGRLLTSLGPGSSFEWGLKLIEQLVGAEVAAAVRGPLCLP